MFKCNFERKFILMFVESDMLIYLILEIFLVFFMFNFVILSYVWFRSCDDC